MDSSCFIIVLFLVDEQQFYSTKGKQFKAINTSTGRHHKTRVIHSHNQNTESRLRLKHKNWIIHSIKEQTNQK